jgi:hypothetical protein
MLSRILAAHPDVLSMSHFVLPMLAADPDELFAALAADREAP